MLIREHTLIVEITLEEENNKALETLLGSIEVLTILSLANLF
jgi:hypothetical protein